MHIYVYTYIDIYVYVHIITCAYTYTCMHLYIHICIYTHIYLYMHKYTHAYIHTNLLQENTTQIAKRQSQIWREIHARLRMPLPGQFSAFPVCILWSLFPATPFCRAFVGVLTHHRRFSCQRILPPPLSSKPPPTPACSTRARAFVASVENCVCVFVWLCAWVSEGV